MREARTRIRKAAALAFSIAGVLLGCPSAFGLNPSLDVSLYAHTPWKIREGSFKGVISAMAQTRDGYLWLGTEYGVVRFDGVRFFPWQPPAGQQPPNIHIKSLLATRDGSLWIGTSEGLARWNGGYLKYYAEFARKSVGALLEDREGVVWAGAHLAPYTRLCAIHPAGAIECFGEDGIFGQTSSESPNATFINSLYEDREANLWVGGVEGLWRWKPGPPRHFTMPDRVQALVENDSDGLGIATLRGVIRIAGETSEPYDLPGVSRTLPARAILRDRNGGLWIGTTDRGVVHVHQGRTDVFGRPEGLSADFVETLFEDREGDIWVATIDGLDRFRDLSVHTLSVGQGLSNATVESVLTARDGAVWLGTMDGLDRWENGHIDIFQKKDGLPDSAIHSLFQDSQDRIWVSTLRGLAIMAHGRFVPVPSIPGGVQAITEDRDGTVWVSQNESLYHVSNGRVVECIPWSRLGYHEYARAATLDLTQGGLWLGFRDSVVHYNGGRIQTTYRVADGLGEGRVRDIRYDRDGALWVSTQGGVSRVKGGAVLTLNSKNGLPCDDALWVMEEKDRSLWIYMACGLAHVSRAELDRWIASGGNDPKHQMQVEVMDASDGVRSHSSRRATARPYRDRRMDDCGFCRGTA